MNYIVPGDKPKECYKCPFMDRITYDCKLMYSNDYPDFESQYKDCPLIELPPHGRLIDGDKFYKVMCSKWVLSLGEAYKRLDEFLENPVIEAEGSET